MPVRQVNVERFSVTSSKPFQEVVGALEGAFGHPDMTSFSREYAAAKTFADIKKVVQDSVGTLDFMQFMRLDHGAVVGKKNGSAAPNCVRFVVGNPLIMVQMVQHVPDAGSYAPVTILVDERPDGVHLSYDRMASFLAPYENSEALQVAQELDAKVEKVLTAAAG